MIKFLSIALLFFSTLQAENLEEFPFLGLTASQSKMNLDHVPSKTEKTFGFRYGKQTQDWRTMFTYSKNGDLKHVDVEIDQILKDNLFNTAKIRPYAGGVFGYISYDSASPTDDSGIYYGATGGLLFYVTDEIDADLSYHYFNIDSFKPVKFMKGLTFSLHYFY